MEGVAHSNRSPLRHRNMLRHRISKTFRVIKSHPRVPEATGSHNPLNTFCELHVKTRHTLVPVAFPPSPCRWICSPPVSSAALSRTPFTKNPAPFNVVDQNHAVYSKQIPTGVLHRRVQLPWLSGNISPIAF